MFPTKRNALQNSVKKCHHSILIQCHLNFYLDWVNKCKKKNPKKNKKQLAIHLWPFKPLPTFHISLKGDIPNIYKPKRNLVSCKENVVSIICHVLGINAIQCHKNVRSLKLGSCFMCFINFKESYLSHQTIFSDIIMSTL